MSWKEDLKKICQETDPHGIFGLEYFGYPLKTFERYLVKLTKLGVFEIKFINYFKIKLHIPGPCDQSDLLIFILTNDIRPNKITYKKYKDISYILTLDF